MEKILSFIIPTYNMAELLPRCLDSILAAGVNDAVEAIVVNDGSRDNSLAVAEEYASKHPECITVIDKPNGNYGSTINAALPVAAGRYVKILDSDDWVDPAGLAEFIAALQKTDADVAVTHFNIINRDGSGELAKYTVYGKEPYEYGRTYDLDEVLGGGHIRFFLMHALAYRVGMLREHGFSQTEGISYTDTEWCCYPMFYARSIVFLNTSVYQYNLAREGQTMDPKVLMRSLDQMCRMTFSLFDFYEAYDRSGLSATRREFLDQYYRNRARLLAKCYLYDIPREQFDAAAFAKIDGRLSDFLRKNSIGRIKLIAENKIIRKDIYKYWRKHGKRPSALLEWTNHLADIAARKAYVLIFRKK